jgi:hypothetical protein
MADVRYKNDTVLVDPTTPTQQLAISAGGAASVNLTASSATVTVDSELPAAAALADAAANPTTPTIGAGNLVFNGTTWDRARESAAAIDSSGTGIPMAGMVGQFDDVSTSTVTENQFAHVRISTRRALLVEGVASGTVIPVSLTSTTVTGTVTVDSELPAAAALADATANPTVPGVGAFLIGYNGTTWDRVRTANTGRLQVDVVTGGGSNASILVDNAGFTDGTSSVTTVGYIFDEVAGTALTENDVAAPRIDAKRAVVNVIEDATTRGQRLAVDASGRASVSLTASSATVTVDTELTAVSALADATANPTITSIAGFLMGYNGTTWDRVRTANTGRLQVDVVTGGSADTPTNPVVKTVTISALAAGASSTTELRTVDLGGLTKKLTKIQVWGSVAFKADLQTVANGAGTSVFVGGAQAFMPYTHEPPGGRGGRNYYSVAHPANAGFDGWQIIVTNLDTSEAADFYAVIEYED